MSGALVPYTFESERARELIEAQAEYPVHTPGTIQGVYIMVPREHQDMIYNKLCRWFQNRPDEVRVIDTGISDKREIGYVMVEWNQRTIEPLFIDILREDETVLDYTIYQHDLQEGEE